jgi:hypothetical protein
VGFKQRYGRKAIAPYAGVKAFLAMEGEEEDQADLVEATELAGQTHLNSSSPRRKFGCYNPHSANATDSV